jgi:3-hydroxybutyryl-CoA dehydratase
VHHVTPDEKGRLMVHGLLTATGLTKIGGDMNFLARERTSNFTGRCLPATPQLQSDDR